MTVDIALRRPLGAPQQLVLLYHGFGSSPGAMAPVGNRLSSAYPRALIIAVAAPYPADVGTGGQWFSLRGINDENRVQRIAAGMDGFVDTVRRWQATARLGYEDTVLAGFSQGATMLLEALKVSPGLAARVLSFGGRFARLPTKPFRGTWVHLLHGGEDPVVHCHHSISAAERLLSIGSQVTLDVRPRVGYAIDDSMLNAALARLLTDAVPSGRHTAANRSVPLLGYEAT